VSPLQFEKTKQFAASAFWEDIIRI